MRSSSLHKQGTTLVEAIVALGLLSLAFLLLSRLAAEYQQLIKFSDARDNMITALSALSEVRRDSEQAFRVDQPSPGASGDRLQVQRLALRLPSRYELQAGDVWRTNSEEELMAISYFLNGGRLIRQVKTPKSLLAFDMVDAVGLSVDHIGGETVTIRLSIQEHQKVEVLSCRAYLWTR